jgi:hypothetical protein
VKSVLDEQGIAWCCGRGEELKERASFPYLSKEGFILISKETSEEILISK